MKTGLLVGIIMVVVGIGLTVAAYSVPLAIVTPTGSYFDHIVILVLENEGISNICGGNPPPCTSSVTPNLANLANTYGIADQYRSVYTPLTSPPNYVAMIAGSTFSCGPGGCGTGVGTLTQTNLIDTLENAGLSWKGYYENFPGSCGNAYGIPPYNIGHNPFVWFSDIYNNPSRCNKLVNANPSSCTVTDCALINDLNSYNAPNYMFVVPNDCNEFHGATNCTNGCNTTPVTTACMTVNDSYLNTLIPNILSSYTFSASRSVLLVTFDEGTGYCPLNGTSEDCIYTVFAGHGVAKNAYFSTVAYNHYSTLKTIEVNWGLPTLGRNDTAASPMFEFLNQLSAPPPPPTSVVSNFTWTPLKPRATYPVTFSGVGIGGTPPYLFNWKFGDGSTGSGQFVSHAFSSAGQFTVSLNITDSSSPYIQKALSTATITVSPNVSPITGTFTFSYPDSTTQPVTFTATVGGGTIPYGFNWNFGDGTVKGGNSTITHTYNAAGQYVVQLLVTDSTSPSQTLLIQNIVTVTGPASTLSTSILINPNPSYINQTVLFGAEITGGVSPYSVTWQFGDSAASYTAAPVHTYTTSGVYTVQLTVTDSSGQSKTTQQMMTVQHVTTAPPPCYTCAPQPQNFFLNNPVLVSGWFLTGIGAFTIVVERKH